MRYEKIIGDALLGKIPVDVAGDMAMAKMLASRYICCKYCGRILDQARIAWLEAENGGVIGVCCNVCYDSKKSELTGIAKNAGLKVKDSRGLAWKR